MSSDEPARSPPQGADSEESSDVCHQDVEDLEEESELALMAQFLSDETLIALTGCEDLGEVRRLEVQINADDLMIRDLGYRIPHLTELKMNGSNVSSIRDLGISLTQLRVLWLSRSGLATVDGIAALPMLTELYLAFNHVSELGPLAECPELACVDLEGNEVFDLSEVDCLEGLTRLESLSLQGCPVADHQGYREAVLTMLPRLTLLDELPRFPKPPPSPLSEDSQDEMSWSWCSGSGSPGAERGRVALGEGGVSAEAGETKEERVMVLEGIKNARAGLDELAFVSALHPGLGGGGARPRTSATVMSRGDTSCQVPGAGIYSVSRPSTAATLSLPPSRTHSSHHHSHLPSLPSSASTPPRRPNSANGGWYFSKKWVDSQGDPGGRPGTAQGGETSGGSRGSSGGLLIGEMGGEESGSDLTHGSQVIFCGSMVKRLREHKVDTLVRKHVEQEQQLCVDAQQCAAEGEGLGIVDSTRSEPIGKDEVLEELRRWKVESASLMVRAEARWNAMRGYEGGDAVQTVVRKGDIIGSSDACDRLIIDDDD